MLTLFWNTRFFIVKSSLTRLAMTRDYECNVEFCALSNRILIWHFALNRLQPHFTPPFPSLLCLHSSFFILNPSIDQADTRALFLNACYFASLYFAWQIHPSLNSWLSVGVLVAWLGFFGFIGATTVHNTMHCRVFKSTQANKVGKIRVGPCLASLRALCFFILKKSNRERSTANYQRLKTIRIFNATISLAHFRPTFFFFFS